MLLALTLMYRQRQRQRAQHVFLYQKHLLHPHPGTHSQSGTLTRVLSRSGLSEALNHQVGLGLTGKQLRLRFGRVSGEKAGLCKKGRGRRVSLPLSLSYPRGAQVGRFFCQSGSDARVGVDISRCASAVSASHVYRTQMKLI